MKDRFLTLLGIESGEESMVSVLLSQSVFLGIYFGAFDISAHSLFLSIFDEKMMARGYVLSGLAGIILTSVYTRMQTRMIFRNFATGNLFFVASLTLILWFLLLLAPSRGVIFLVFIMLGPLNILAMLGFWGTVSRLFTLRQGKRLFGLVDAGLIIGIIISCYAIPVLLSLNFESHNILLISSAAVLSGSFIQIIIGKRFLSAPVKSTQETRTIGKKKSLGELFLEDSYIRIMGLFIALSVMTAFFVQYSFMAVTREQYPAEEDMARFLGIFTGSMMIFTLLIKLLVFSYLIRNYGLRTCLALSPVLVAAFTVIAVTIGMIMGYTPATSGFMLFFMMLALSRLFSKSIKDSIESPSLKVIYQTIDEKNRYEVQSSMDGTVNEMAALASGLLLAGLGILSFIKLIHFSLVLFIITLLWIFVAVKLYTGYRKSIRKALESGGQEKHDINLQTGDKVLKSRFSAALAFNNEYFNLISGNHTSMTKDSNSLLVSKILEHADKNRDISLLPALRFITSHSGADAESRQRSAVIAESLEILLTAGQQKEDKILNAQKILAGTRQPQTTQILRLLRDNSPESKKLAIFMIGKFRITDMISEVCECLNIPGLELQAASVLRGLGKNADEALSRYYLISAGNPAISKTILQLMSDNCRKENQSFLFSRLWSNSRQIREATAGWLIDCGYKAPEEEKDRLHQLITDIIGIMVWNLSTKICLERNNETLVLEALHKEIERWNTFLFNILSITYDSGSIQRIRENLSSGTVESVNYALEMIDMVIDDSIKPKLIPLLDIISDEEKVKNLYQFFPGEIHEKQKLMEDIINRDYNLLGIWIRACAIRNMPEIEREPLKESLVALLFSPETILKEESVKLIARSGKELYKSASVRIPVQSRRQLDKIVSDETNENELLYEKVRFLSFCIEGMIEEDLLWLAGKLEYSKEINPELLTDEGGYIIWRGDPENVEIIYETQTKDGERPGKNVRGYCYLLPLRFVEEYNYLFPEKSGVILKFIETNVK
ncbi:MAG: hypothetical protein MUC93_01725 [Bacteroidales bacterium]|jgi:ATP/ADP translocase|nr:hypothetical protein [Bacteroidales bacterium]